MIVVQKLNAADFAEFKDLAYTQKGVDLLDEKLNPIFERSTWTFAGSSIAQFMRYKMGKKGELVFNDIDMFMLDMLSFNQIGGKRQIISRYLDEKALAKYGIRQVMLTNLQTYGILEKDSKTEEYDNAFSGKYEERNMNIDSNFLLSGLGNMGNLNMIFSNYSVSHTIYRDRVDSGAFSDTDLELNDKVIHAIAVINSFDLNIVKCALTKGHSGAWVVVYDSVLLEDEIGAECLFTPFHSLVRASIKSTQLGLPMNIRTPELLYSCTTQTNGEVFKFDVGKKYSDNARMFPQLFDVKPYVSDHQNLRYVSTVSIKDNGYNHVFNEMGIMTSLQLGMAEQKFLLFTHRYYPEFFSYVLTEMKKCIDSQPIHADTGENYSYKARNNRDNVHNSYFRQKFSWLRTVALSFLGHSSLPKEILETFKENQTIYDTLFNLMANFSWTSVQKEGRPANYQIFMNKVLQKNSYFIDNMIPRFAKYNHLAENDFDPGRYGNRIKQVLDVAVYL